MPGKLNILPKEEYFLNRITTERKEEKSETYYYPHMHFYLCFNSPVEKSLANSFVKCT